MRVYRLNMYAFYGHSYLHEYKDSFPLCCRCMYSILFADTYLCSEYNAPFQSASMQEHTRSAMAKQYICFLPRPFMLLSVQSQLPVIMYIYTTFPYPYIYLTAVWHFHRGSFTNTLFLFFFLRSGHTFNIEVVFGGGKFVLYFDRI